MAGVGKLPYSTSLRREKSNMVLVTAAKDCKWHEVVQMLEAGVTEPILTASVQFRNARPPVDTLGFAIKQRKTEMALFVMGHMQARHFTPGGVSHGFDAPNCLDLAVDYQEEEVALQLVERMLWEEIDPHVIWILLSTTVVSGMSRVLGALLSRIPFPALPPPQYQTVYLLNEAVMAGMLENLQLLVSAYEEAGEQLPHTDDAGNTVWHEFVQTCREDDHYSFLENAPHDLEREAKAATSSDMYAYLMEVFPSQKFQPNKAGETPWDVARCLGLEDLCGLQWGPKSAQ